jgi:hypothetical protein
MSKVHVVKQGDHLSALAEENGFANFHTIFDHGDNADLKALRDPHTLFPGDRVFIPDAVQRTEQRSTNTVNIFTADVPKLLLRLRLLDVDGVTVKSIACDVTVPPNTAPSAETTDGGGVLEKQIGRGREQRGTVVAHQNLATPTPEGDTTHDITYDLVIGNLNPHVKLSGQQARLSNLGYFAGYTVRDLDALLWAAEEFRCDHVGKRLKGRPPIKPAPAGGEDAPDPANVDGPTGIVKADLVEKLRQVHGV